MITITIDTTPLSQHHIDILQRMQWSVLELIPNRAPAKPVGNKGYFLSSPDIVSYTLTLEAKEKQ